MNSVNSILGKPCVLFTECGAEFQCVFSLSNKNIWINASAFNDYAIEFVKNRRSDEFSKLCGEISGTPVTAISTISGTSYCTIGSIDLSMFLDKLIIGVKSFDELVINSISAEIPALDWFYMDTAIIMDFESTHPSFSLKLDEPLSAKWFNGKINIYRKYTFSDSFSGSSHLNRNILEFNSTKGVSLRYACQRLFETHSLFVFLADSGINVLPEMNIRLKGDENLYSIYFNDMEYFNKEISSPFRIRYNTTKGKYNSIIKNWNTFYSRNKEVVELYVEIVAKHSRRVNRFLDLARIIETYSKRNRDNDAKNICRKYNVNCKSSSCSNCETCGQYYRYLEMFITYGRALPTNAYLPSIFNRNMSLNTNKIETTCNDITLLRNHYAHYGEPRGKNKVADKRRLSKLLKSQFVYGRYSNLLHLLMLSVIYNQLGFLDDEIRVALTGGESGRFGDTLEVIYGK